MAVLVTGTTRLVAPISGAAGSAFTMVAWAYTTGYGSTQAPFSNAPVVSIFADATPGTYSRYIYVGGAGTANEESFAAFGPSGTDFMNTPPLPLNTWRHIALTRSASGQLRHYVNGVMIAQLLSPASGVFPAWTFFQVGPFDGAVQDAAVFSTELSLVQIRALMRRRGKSPGLVPLRAYPMTGLGSALLADYSGQGVALAVDSGTASQTTLAAPVSWGGPTGGRLAHRYTEVVPTPPIPPSSGGGFGNRRRLVSLARRPVRA